MCQMREILVSYPDFLGKHVSVKSGMIQYLKGSPLTQNSDGYA